MVVAAAVQKMTAVAQAGQVAQAAAVTVLLVAQAQQAQ
jgi:hypothetical protein